MENAQGSYQEPLQMVEWVVFLFKALSAKGRRVDDDDSDSSDMSQMTSWIHNMTEMMI